jgi:hypothetical protein
MKNNSKLTHSEIIEGLTMCIRELDEAMEKIITESKDAREAMDRIIAKAPEYEIINKIKESFFDIK